MRPPLSPKQELPSSSPPPASEEPLKLELERASSPSSSASPSSGTLAAAVATIALCTRLGFLLSRRKAARADSRKQDAKAVGPGPGKRGSDIAEPTRLRSSEAPIAHCSSPSVHGAAKQSDAAIAIVTADKPQAQAKAKAQARSKEAITRAAPGKVPTTLLKHHADSPSYEFLPACRYHSSPSLPIHTKLPQHEHEHDLDMHTEPLASHHHVDASTATTTTAHMHMRLQRFRFRFDSAASTDDMLFMRSHQYAAAEPVSNADRPRRRSSGAPFEFEQRNGARVGTSANSLSQLAPMDPARQTAGPATIHAPAKGEATGPVFSAPLAHDDDELSRRISLRRRRRQSNSSGESSRSSSSEASAVAVAAASAAGGAPSPSSPAPSPSLASSRPSADLRRKKSKKNRTSSGSESGSAAAAAIQRRESAGSSAATWEEHDHDQSSPSWASTSWSSVEHTTDEALRVSVLPPHRAFLSDNKPSYHHHHALEDSATASPSTPISTGVVFAAPPDEHVALPVPALGQYRPPAHSSAGAGDDGEEPPLGLSAADLEHGWPAFGPLSDDDSAISSPPRSPGAQEDAAHSFYSSPPPADGRFRLRSAKQQPASAHDERTAEREREPPPFGMFAVAQAPTGEDGRPKSSRGMASSASGRPTSSNSRPSSSAGGSNLCNILEE